MMPSILDCFLLTQWSSTLKITVISSRSHANLRYGGTGCPHHDQHIPSSYRCGLATIMMIQSVPPSLPVFLSCACDTSLC
jgi:hypothetical protein